MPPRSTELSRRSPSRRGPILAGQGPLLCDLIACKSSALVCKIAATKINMNDQSSVSYPGESATPAEVSSLADEYRLAALLLLENGRPKEPKSRAPFRMVAIHAVELYLNAFLLHSGHDAAQIRGFQHNLAARADLAVELGLALRKRTHEHLHTMSQSREFLITRYAPSVTSLSEINRLQATLAEVAQKVSAII